MLANWRFLFSLSMIHSMRKSIQFFKTTLFVTLVLVALSLQGASQPARVVKARNPKASDFPDCRAAHCINLPGNLRVCKRACDAEDGFVIEKAGKRLAKWPAAVFVGETSDFEVLQTDLDGDGQKELIVSNHEATSNGLGRNYWMVYIFPDATFRRPTVPLRFNVEDYGSTGTFIAEGKSIFILETKWMWMEDPRGKRGEGLYLTGHWWRYKSGTLVPAAGRPVLARRYLESFAAERWKTEKSPGIPYRWLQSPKAEILKKNPLIDAQEKEAKDGELQTVSESSLDQLETPMMLVFQPRVEGPITLSYPENDFYIGDSGSGVIYPDRYSPASPKPWLAGRKARLVTYKRGAGDDTFQVLWLERNQSTNKE